MYFETGDHVPMKLEAERGAARQARLEANRARSCEDCAENKTREELTAA